MPALSPTRLDRAGLAAWYRSNRARSAALFGCIDPGVYYDAPIPLRHPFVFYEGHFPAFSFITLLRNGLGEASIDRRLEDLFNRGIDPDSIDTARTHRRSDWPSRLDVRAFAQACDERVFAALTDARLENSANPQLERGLAAVNCSNAQAAGFAAWSGARLLTEAEFHRAAYGTPSGGERHQPWGGKAADPARGNFDVRRFDPEPIGSSPQGASAWGIHDLVGNGWEWTSTPFEPFQGFEPMVSYLPYSADFFDGEHFVMKGASPATSRNLVRRSFRNWYRRDYLYMYATFRRAWD